MQLVCPGFSLADQLEHDAVLHACVPLLVCVGMHVFAIFASCSSLEELPFPSDQPAASPIPLLVSMLLQHDQPVADLFTQVLAQKQLLPCGSHVHCYMAVLLGQHMCAS